MDRMKLTMHDETRKLFRQAIVAFIPHVQSLTDQFFEHHEVWQKVDDSQHGRPTVLVVGKPGALIWIGDSIPGTVVCNARTVWLPVTIKSPGQLEIRWRDAWDPSVFRRSSSVPAIAIRKSKHS